MMGKSSWISGRELEKRLAVVRWTQWISEADTMKQYLIEQNHDKMSKIGNRNRRNVLLVVEQPERNMKSSPIE